MTRTEAQQKAFEACKAARQAALEKKKTKKVSPVEPVPEPPIEPVEPEPVPEEVEVEPEPEPVVQEEEDDLEFADMSEIVDLIQQQGTIISALHEEVKGLRAHQMEITQKQTDLTTSFSEAGISTRNSLNFV